MSKEANNDVNMLARYRVPELPARTTSRVLALEQDAAKRHFFFLVQRPARLEHETADCSSFLPRQQQQRRRRHQRFLSTAKRRRTRSTRPSIDVVRQSSHFLSLVASVFAVLLLCLVLAEGFVIRPVDRLVGQQQEGLRRQQLQHDNHNGALQPVRTSSSSAAEDFNDFGGGNGSNGDNDAGNSGEQQQKQGASFGDGSGVVLKDLNWRVEKLRLEEQNTKRFLKSKPRFLPYEDCRNWVQAWGARWENEQDWRDWIAMGEKRNAYIPSRPDEYYGDQW